MEQQHIELGSIRPLWLQEHGFEPGGTSPAVFSSHKQPCSCCNTTSLQHRGHIDLCRSSRVPRFLLRSVMNWNNLSSICFSHSWCQRRSWERPPGVFRETHCSRKPWGGISLPPWPAGYALNHTVCFSYIPSACEFWFVYWPPTPVHGTAVYSTFVNSLGFVANVIQVTGVGSMEKRKDIGGNGTGIVSSEWALGALIVLGLLFAWHTGSSVLCTH